MLFLPIFLWHLLGMHLFSYYLRGYLLWLYALSKFLVLLVVIMIFYLHFLSVFIILMHCCVTWTLYHTTNIVVAIWKTLVFSSEIHSLTAFYCFYQTTHNHTPEGIKHHWQFRLYHFVKFVSIILIKYEENIPTRKRKHYSTMGWHSR